MMVEAERHALRPRRSAQHRLHYTRPGRPDERALRLLDLLGRQAADMIERSHRDEALKPVAVPYTVS
jgi:hypothetical protein